MDDFMDSYQEDYTEARDEMRAAARDDVFAEVEMLAKASGIDTKVEEFEDAFDEEFDELGFDDFNPDDFLQAYRNGEFEIDHDLIAFVNFLNETYVSD